MVARTDAVARDCLAKPVKRGTPELTIQDAVRAGEAEVRRGTANRAGDSSRGSDTKRDPIVHSLLDPSKDR